jgi:HAD superfamily hydrolase (TIGR01549 family)
MSTRWNPFVKQLVTIVALVAMIWLLMHVSVLLGPLVLALLLAYLASFPARAILRRTGWPRTVVIALIYLLVLVFIITAPVLIIPRLVSLLAAFSTTLVNVVQELSTASPRPIVLTPSLTLDLNVFLAPINQWLESVLEPSSAGGSNLLNLLFPFASSAAVVVSRAVSSVLAIFFILVVSFYVAKDGPSMGRWVTARLPEAFRPEAQRLARELTLVWDAFVRGQVTLAFLMGVITWVMLTILGIRSAPALALLSGLAEFVPGVGPVSAALVGIVIALILGSTWLPMPHQWFALLVALLYFLATQFENLYLVPRVVGRRIALHPVVVIVGALAGASLGGVLGILLAAPVIASLRVVGGYIIHKLVDEDPFPPVQPPPDRGLVWQELLREHEVCAVLFDLDGTLIEPDDTGVERLAQRLGPVRRLFPDVNLVRLARRLFLISHVIISGLVTLLEVLRAEKLLARLHEPLRQAQGIRAPGQFVPVPGSVEMLRWLSRRYRLGIVTTRSRAEAHAFLAQYGLTPLFRSVITRDDLPLLRPHPLPVQMAAKELAAPPEQCVMVGDTTMDVRAAKGAGMLCIGVLSGFGAESDLGDADLMVNSTAQLAAWL